MIFASLRIRKTPIATRVAIQEGGNLWYLDKSATSLAYGAIFNGGSQQFVNGAHSTELSSISVSTGDVIYLAIHPNGSYGCDNTGIDLTISLAAAPTPTSTIAPNPTPIYQFNG